jgi:hypoxanthine phosphoribosyltransferase
MATMEYIAGEAFLSDPIAPLLTTAQIEEKVRELGAAITRDYRGLSLVMVCVLKGSFVFAADLARAISLPLRIEFLGVRSYGTGTSSSGVVQITHDLQNPIEGEDVLLVEDIVDTGLTLHFLLAELNRRNPRSLEACALLDRTARRIIPTPVDYAGFEVGDEFVLGYGLDFAQRYRNLDRVVVADLDVLRRDPDAYVGSLWAR